MHAVPNCQFCRTPLTATLVDLGDLPLANRFLSEDDVAKERRYRLRVRICPSCLLVQIDTPVPPDEIFSSGYPYFSSVTDSWVEHARRYAERMIARLKLGPQSLVIEIASNDGYLLQHFVDRGVPVLGVEPAANVAKAAIDKGVATEVSFFNTRTARRLAAAGKYADLMVANNVLAHVPDIRDFVAAFAILLKADGVATFEFPHVLNLVCEVQFDTIYHEHCHYLSLMTVERIFAAMGMKIIEVEELQTHGGSLRVYASKKGSSHVDADLHALREKEKAAGLDRLEGYAGYAERVGTVKKQFLAFLRHAKRTGKKVAAYGAAAKGNTLLNFCGVTKDDIICVFDRSSAKQNKLLPGSHIPVFAPKRLAEVKPDYLVILPWNIANEIMTEKAILSSWGGKFVVAVPSVRVFS